MSVNLYSLCKNKEIKAFLKKKKKANITLIMFRLKVRLYWHKPDASLMKRKKNDRRKKRFKSIPKI